MNTLRVTGGRVLRPDGRVTESDVTIDRDAGTIVAVGDETVSDAEAGSDAEVASDGETLDASGSLVIPGLVNAHTHVAMTLLRGYADDKPLDPWLREDIWPAEAELTPDDIEAGAELGVVEMIRSGTTAFADMYFAMDRVADVVDRAGLRARLGHGVVTIGKDAEGARADVEESLAVARELDGAGDGRIRTAFMPHSLTTVGEEYLHEGVAEAREAGVPIHLHANETEDEVDPIVDERGGRPIAYAQDLDALGPDDFFAHGVHLDGSEIDQIADAGGHRDRPPSGLEHEARKRDGPGPAAPRRGRHGRARHRWGGLEQRPRCVRRDARRRHAREARCGRRHRGARRGGRGDGDGRRCRRSRPPRRSDRSSRARPPTSPSLTSTPRT